MSRGRSFKDDIGFYVFNPKECKNYIYFAICRAGKNPSKNDKVKIGISRNPEKRISNLQTGSPYDIFIWYKFPVKSAKIMERNLHEKFKYFRIKGEWFKMHKTIEEFVEIHKNISKKDLNSEKVIVLRKKV